MEKSKVYFTDMRCEVGESLLAKLDRLIVRAGIGEIDFRDRFTAIKLNFGEPGNLAFLRPNFIKTLADRVKALGGLPFMTDCNTLYVGRRKNALEHLLAAQENGFGMLSTGCSAIIADGLKGTDDVEVEVPGGIYCKTAKIGRAVMDADIIISATHFKGHEMTGFGGAIKNLGMGCGSRAGKMQMHYDTKPYVSREACTACGACAVYCAQGALSYDGDTGKAGIDEGLCVGCGRCIGVCFFDAILNSDWCANDALNSKMAEYVLAVVHGRPHFHVSIVNQVSPNCDCHEENDAAVVPDIGMFASFDPVALDKACIDAVNAAPPVMASIQAERAHDHGSDHFRNIHPTTDWRSQIRHAERIGLGSGEYELITI